VVEIGDKSLTLDEIARIAYGREAVRLSAKSVERMHRSRRAVEEVLSRGDVVYGVNTGFGRLSDVAIAPNQIRLLQRNLVLSHACGVGRPLSDPEVRAMLVLRANVLGLGFSGVRPDVAVLLTDLLNAGISPIVPEKGSVGASGDLAPLAHLSLPLIGEGEVTYQGKRFQSADAFREAGLSTVQLEAKEGLALLNGTQAINAVGGLAIHRALRVLRAANVAAAMSLEALLGTPTAFDDRIHAARPHPAQRRVAAALRAMLENSEIRASHLKGDPRVQDAYSLRCVPQVHGAALTALEHARSVFDVESGSVTDNPLIFCEEGASASVLSGGNFHGAPLGLVLDYAAIAIADLGGICERRIDRLINPDLNESLPPFLTRHPGVSSGFMIAHVAAVSLLSECKVLSHPASVDNLPTSGGKEDHVSMGMTAALKFREMVGNVEQIVAIELLCGAQGIDFRRPLRSGEGVEGAHTIVREASPALNEDRSMAPDIDAVARAIRAGLFETLASDVPARNS